MKKIIVAMLAVVLCLSFSMTALAADYVPSIEKKDAPEIVVKEEGGKQIIADIVDDNGNVDDNIEIGQLIITGYDEKDNDNPDISDEKQEQIKLNLEKSLEEIKQKSPAELNKDVDAIAKTYNQNADATIFEATDIFDLSFSDDEKVAEYEQALRDGKSIVVTLDLDMEPDEEKPVILVRDSETGAWEMVSQDNIDVNSDGTVKAKFNRLGTVAVFKLNIIKLKDLDGTQKRGGDTAKVGLWVGIVGVAVIATVAIAIIKRKKED